MDAVTQLLDKIGKLQDALRAVERWSLETATDLTATGYDRWSQLIPPQLTSEPETPPPLDQTSSYELDPHVNTSLRSVILGSAAVVQTLAISFHPHRGEAGLRRDLDRARQILKLSYAEIGRAQAILDRKQTAKTFQ